MRLQLTTQLLDVNLQGIGEPVVPFIPDMLVNPRSRQDLAGMPQEEDQQGVLLGREMKCVAVAFGPLGRQINAHVSID